MPDVNTPPVFIHQTADYQQAAAKLSELANYQAPLAAAAQELGLTGELQQTKDALNNLKGQAQVLETNDRNLQVQNQASVQEEHVKHARAGLLAVASAGVGLVAAGIAKAAKSTRAVGVGLAAGGVTALFSATNLLGEPGKSDKDAEKAAILNKMEENRVTFQALTLQENFIDRMATRMLEQQKALSGTGENIKLVPAAQAAPATISMAEKYAAAPAESKASAIADQRADLATAQAR